MTSQGAAELLKRWRDDLAAWAIPEEIASGADASPWVLPVALFAHRAEQQLRAPQGPTYQRALEALQPRGEVLDVGAGGGAASLPLARWTSRLLAVDSDQGMLDDLAARAARLGVETRTVHGRWPDVAAEVPPADVAVCRDVLYNVPDLAPFAAALTDHARRRVVVELTARHPLARLNPLWRRFHGLDRPAGPTAADAEAALRALGLAVEATSWTRVEPSEHHSFEALVEVTRRRLCLPRARAQEVAEALLEQGVDPAHPVEAGTTARPVVTAWWPGTAGDPATAPHGPAG